MLRDDSFVVEQMQPWASHPGAAPTMAGMDAAADRSGLDEHVLERRLGGAVGGHAARGGIWFDPAPWVFLTALVTWLLCIWHNRPCQQKVAGQPVNALLRLCYSDIPIVYQSTGFATGQRPYLDFALDYGTVTAAFMVVARWISRALGHPSAVGVTPQQELDASYAWFLVSAVLLFACFVALSAAHLLIGRGSSWSQGARVRERVRSWDAVMVAGAPVVAAAGLVNWDVLAASLVGVGLLAWALRRPMLAGALLGLGVGTKFYPVVIVIGIIVLCARAGRSREGTRLAIGALVAWLATNLPILVLAPARWMQWYTGWTSSDAELGSIWFLLGQWHVEVPRPGIVGALLFLALAAFVVQRALMAPRRPRVGQIAFLLVAAMVLTDRGYPPQHVVWLLPLLVLARPVLVDWAVFCGAELLYFWAVWGHLNGSTVVSGEPDVWYWLAIMLRTAVLVWLCLRVLGDMRRPWNDPVRTPFTDDPAGGVLDHAPDAEPEPDDADLLTPFSDDGEEPEQPEEPNQSEEPDHLAPGDGLRVTPGGPTT